MKSLIEILDEVISPVYKMPVTDILTITEKHKDAKCKEVKLRQAGKIYVMTLDNGVPDVYPFFQEREELHIKKKNDAILFCNKNNKTYIFLIELKSNKPQDGLPQLKAASHFVDYLLAIIKLQYTGLSVGVEKRGIIFHTRQNVNKRPDRRTSKAKYQTIGNLRIAFAGCNQEHSLEYFMD